MILIVILNMIVRDMRGENMSSKEFVETVRMNSKSEYIAKGTKFNVYKSIANDFEYICTVTVDRTTLKYLITKNSH